MRTLTSSRAAASAAVASSVPTTLKRSTIARPATTAASKGSNLSQQTLDELFQALVDPTVCTSAHVESALRYLQQDVPSSLPTAAAASPSSDIARISRLAMRIVNHAILNLNPSSASGGRQTCTAQIDDWIRMAVAAAVFMDVHEAAIQLKPLDLDKAMSRLAAKLIDCSAAKCAWKMLETLARRLMAALPNASSDLSSSSTSSTSSTLKGKAKPPAISSKATKAPAKSLVLNTRPQQQQQQRQQQCSYLQSLLPLDPATTFPAENALLAGLIVNTQVSALRITASMHAAESFLPIDTIVQSLAGTKHFAQPFGTCIRWVERLSAVTDASAAQQARRYLTALYRIAMKLSESSPQMPVLALKAAAFYSFALSDSFSLNSLVDGILHAGISYETSHQQHQQQQQQSLAELVQFYDVCVRQIVRSKLDGASVPPNLVKLLEHASSIASNSDPSILFERVVPMLAVVDDLSTRCAASDRHYAVVVEGAAQILALAVALANIGSSCSDRLVSFVKDTLQALPKFSARCRAGLAHLTVDDIAAIHRATNRLIRAAISFNMHSPLTDDARSLAVQMMQAGFGVASTVILAPAYLNASTIAETQRDRQLGMLVELALAQSRLQFDIQTKQALQSICAMMATLSKLVGGLSSRQFTAAAVEKARQSISSTLYNFGVKLCQVRDGVSHPTVAVDFLALACEIQAGVSNSDSVAVLGKRLEGLAAGIEAASSSSGSAEDDADDCVFGADSSAKNSASLNAQMVFAMAAAVYSVATADVSATIDRFVRSALRDASSPYCSIAHQITSILSGNAHAARKLLPSVCAILDRNRTDSLMATLTLAELRALGDRNWPEQTHLAVLDMYRSSCDSLDETLDTTSYAHLLVERAVFEFKIHGPGNASAAQECLRLLEQAVQLLPSQSQSQPAARGQKRTVKKQSQAPTLFELFVALLARSQTAIISIASQPSDAQIDEAALLDSVSCTLMALQQCVSESGIVGIDDTHVADLAAHLLHLCEWSSAMGISQLHSHSANAGIVILQQWSQQQQQQQQQQHRSPTPETGSRRTPSRVVQFISNLDSIRIQFHVEAARACIDVGNGDAKQHIQAAQAVDDSSSLTIDPAALAALHTAAALQSVYNSSVEQAQEFIRAAKDIMSQIDADSSADGTADAPPSNGRRNPPAAPRAARSRNRSTAVSTGRAVGWCNIHYIESLVACRLGNLDGAIGCVMRGCALLKACIESTARHDAQRRRRFDELRKRQSRSGSHRSSPQTLFNSDDNDNDNGNDAEGDVFSNTAAAPSDANPALLAQLVQEQESAADSSTKQLQQKKAELDACSSHPLCRLAFDLFSLAGALMATFGLAGDAEYALQTGLSMAHAANSTVWIQRLSLSLANLCTRRGHWAKADELLGGLQLVDGSVEHALWLVFKARLIFNRSDIEQTLEDYAHTVDGALAAIGSLIQSVGSDGSESTMASSLTALHEYVQADMAHNLIIAGVSATELDFESIESIDAVLERDHEQDSVLLHPILGMPGIRFETVAVAGAAKVAMCAALLPSARRSDPGMCISIYKASSIPSASSAPSAQSSNTVRSDDDDDGPSVEQVTAVLSTVLSRLDSLLVDHGGYYAASEHSVSIICSTLLHGGFLLDSAGSPRFVSAQLALWMELSEGLVAFRRLVETHRRAAEASCDSSAALYWDSFDCDRLYTAADSVVGWLPLRPSSGVSKAPVHERFIDTISATVPSSWCSTILCTGLTTDELYAARLSGSSVSVMRIEWTPCDESVGDDTGSIDAGSGHSLSRALQVLDDIVAANDAGCIEAASKMANASERSLWWSRRLALETRLKDLVQSMSLRLFGGLLPVMTRSYGSHDTDVHSVIVKAVAVKCAGVKKSALAKAAKDARFDPLVLDILATNNVHAAALVVDTVSASLQLDSPSVDVSKLAAELHSVVSSRVTSAHSLLVLGKTLHRVPWEALMADTNSSCSRTPCLWIIIRSLQSLRHSSQPRSLFGGDDDIAAAVSSLDIGDDTEDEPSAPVVAPTMTVRRPRGGRIPKTAKKPAAVPAVAASLSDASDSESGIAQVTSMFAQRLQLASSTVASAGSITLKRAVLTGLYVLNPSGDLVNTQKLIHEPLMSISRASKGWTGVVGRPPMSLQIEHSLREHSLYMYFGHGGGELYISNERIRRVAVSSSSASRGGRAVAMLFGCSSGKFRQGGSEFGIGGTMLDYLIAGCPAVLGTLWNVTDRDADKFSLELMRIWSLSGQQPKDESENEQVWLTQAVSKASHVCKMRLLNGAAPVVYGIPDVIVKQ